MAGQTDESEIRPTRAASVPTLQEAWRKLDGANPGGWHAGQESLHDERELWIQYAFGPGHSPMVGVRSRDWEAVARTEVDVVREMTRCLGDIKAGRVPR